MLVIVKGVVGFSLGFSEVIAGYGVFIFGIYNLVVFGFAGMGNS